MAIRVAVDAMGADDAPEVVIDGALQAVAQSETPLELLLFGPAAQVQAALDKRAPNGHPGLTVVDAPDVITMDESPTKALKQKRNSSIHLGLGALKAGHVDAFASGGNTGAVMAASLFVLGRLPGVARSTLIGYYPTVKSYCIVLDVGANVDCKPEYLLQFAQMGSIYAEKVMRRPRPAIGLLNIGEEPGKGNEQAKAAYDLLAAADGLHFIGNIEGRDVLHHAADVVICDGFVGNVILKLGESVATALPALIRTELARQNLPPEAQQIVAQVVHGVGERFNYEAYGGALLLGVRGNVVIGHGGSSPRAIARMIEVATEAVSHDISGAITATLNPDA